MLYYSGNSMSFGRRAAGRRRIALGHFLFVLKVFQEMLSLRRGQDRRP